ITVTSWPSSSSCQAVVTPTTPAPRTTTCMTVSSLARGRDHDLDRVVRVRELALDAGARRRVAGRDPGVPHLVHFIEGRDVGEPDVGGEQLRFVGARLGEQLVDGRQDVPGLLGDRGAARILRDLTGGEHHVAVDHALAHPRPDLEALNAHDWFLPSLAQRKTTSEEGLCPSGQWPPRQQVLLTAIASGARRA